MPSRRAPSRTLAEPTFSAAGNALLLDIGGDLYHYDLTRFRLTRLTSDSVPEDDPAFSPDGRLVAFTRANDLYVVDIASGRERRLTSDGGPDRLNGKLDWIYQEEIYGRGTYRAFWWSPDSTRLAFLQLDEGSVPAFTITDHIPRRQELEVYPYPKPGDPNPTVRAGVVAAVGGVTQWIDTTKYSRADHLIVSVGWSPDSRDVVYQVQDREQTWLDLNRAEAGSGTSRILFRETTKAWVDNPGEPVWLRDGSFLWLSERSGWEHVYRYTAQGALDKQITTGKWEVRTLHGVDEAGGWIYFSGTERSPIGGDVYRVKLDGSGLARLSQPDGTHVANFSPSLARYVDSWSTITKPPQVRVHRADGSEVRVVDGRAASDLSQFVMGAVEQIQVPTRDGFQMEAVIIKPPGFDASKKYPVFQWTYAGPHAPRVKNSWGGIDYLYLQLLAQQGIVVWICDNRSASGKGAESAWANYKQLGVSELADIEDGISWLKKQPWVDGTRIGISGWSYGGFMVSYALTHSTSFAMGIAGGPVTDWTLYDSIYTERFMLTPQNNPEGYRVSSPLLAAKNLSGRLLLVHGLIDDNVHPQNTIKFAYELQKAGKPFELMLYPKSRHGLTDAALIHHMRATMFDFTMRTLRPAGAAAATNTASRP